MDRTSTYLERSKAAPIDVEAVKTRVSPNDLALGQVAPHLGRVRSMKITPSPGETLPAAFEFRSPAPLLRDLVVTGFPERHLSRLPRDFLGRHVPSLRSLVWSDTPISQVPFSLSVYDLIRLPYAFEAPDPLRAALGVISSAPLLERISLWIFDADILPYPPPVQDIRLDSLCHLDLVSGTALSRAIPHFKVPRLKRLSLFLPFDVNATTIADLLPSDSYPLLTEVISMVFYTLPKESSMFLEGEDTEVSVTTFPRVNGPTDDFFTTTPFPLAQITRLTLKATTAPMAAKICEFTNLKHLDLQRCDEEEQVLSDLSPFPQPGSLVSCPCLTTIKVTFCNPITRVVNCLRQMVKSRKEAGNHLVTIKLDHLDGVEEMLDIDERNEWIGQAPDLE
jgi:hypothetical protein